MDSVDTAAAKLGLTEGMCTDPALLRDVFENTMRLGDFVPIADVVAPYLDAPTSLDPLIDSIKGAIRKRYPAIVATLIELEDLDPVEDVDTVRWVLHLTFLVELVAREMVRSPAFMVDLHTYIQAKRNELELPDDFIGFVRTVKQTTDSAFEAAKIRTLDLVINQYMSLREREPGPAEARDILRKNAGLKLNIMEAVLSDTQEGDYPNARVGFKLTQRGVRELRVEGEDRIIKQVLPPGWVALYHSWAIAFIISNVDNIDILVTKLLVPTVMDAEPDDYLFRRGIVLWFVGNVALLNEIDAGGQREQRIPRLTSIANRWGQVNLRESEGFLTDTRSATC